MTDDEYVINIMLEGRSTGVELKKWTGPIIHIAEGIVYDGEIVWCAPNPPEVTVCNVPTIKILKMDDLIQYQCVSLLTVSYFNVAEVIFEVYDDFIKKISDGDKKAIQIIRDAVAIIEQKAQ